jgi:predicted GH43/DUF377 family glycosyl hydrolase
MKRGIILLILALALQIANLAVAQTSWQRYAGNPVLSPKADWEAGGNINNTVVKVGNEYKHWFTGIGDRFRIGTATSTDGITWQKSNANPVLNVGAAGQFDSEHVYTPMVVYHDSLYWMWYAGNNGVNWQIGLATSKDGVQWKKHPDNPVLKIGAAAKWDDKHLISPFVMRDGTVFKMWYRGESAQFPGKGSAGYAESPDGVHWERYSGNPVFSPTASAWDSRSLTIYPIVKREGKYEGWYAGSDGSTSQIGYVTSSDGINWQRYSGNPVLSPTRTNSWDGEQISSPFVLFETTVYKMWYSGFGSSGWRIGYATSQATITPVAKRFVYIPRIYGLPGDTITVTLFADTVSTISGGDVTIKFDATTLKAFKLQSTKHTRDFLIVANLDTPGVAHVSLASPRAVAGGPGGLFNIKMIVNPSLPVPPFPQPQPLKLTKVSFYTENGKAIPITKRDGEFILGRTRGDVNRDGRVNSADAILTLRIAAGLLIPTPDQLADADIDRNSRVESLDAICMLHQAVGLDCPPGGVANTAANLSIAPFSIDAGHEIETKISVTGIDKLLGGDVDLRFDSNALEIIDIQPSPEMANVAFVNNLLNTGRANFSFAAASGFQTRTIAVVRLRAKSRITEKNLRSNNATLFDGQGKRWNGVLTGVAETGVVELPAHFRLEQNYPNPFYLSGNAHGIATKTEIHYALPQNSHVTLAVYDINGRLVRLLEDAEKSAGAYVQVWDGKNEFQTPAVPGFYFYRVRAGQMTLTRKLLLLP